MIWQDYLAGKDAGQHHVHGNIKCATIHSPELDNSREVLVYLPPSYAESERRYPVLYMHDGQNLFDPATSFSGEWEVDQTMEDASREGLEAIVVGIANAGAERLNEYSPFVDAKNGGGKGDAYLTFIARTLKPMIDAAFRTEPGRHQTGIIGSSMGGLISLYGFFHNSDTFGFCGAMSPALWFAQRAIFDYVEKADFAPGRIYIDCGTGEGEAEVKDVERMCELLARKGYRSRYDYLCVIEKDATHSESAWAGRVRREMQFLLGVRPGGGRRAMSAQHDSPDT